MTCFISAGDPGKVITLLQRTNRTAGSIREPQFTVFWEGGYLSIYCDDSQRLSKKKVILCLMGMFMKLNGMRPALFHIPFSA